MQEISSPHFYTHLFSQKKHFPWIGMLELTYRCNLNCIHCYSKGLGNKAQELNTSEWKAIIDEIRQEGCVYLTLSGGEPLIREDFLEIYTYAKKKGFLITLFTNGLALTKEILRILAKSPPYSIEVTFNGITSATYEKITRIKGSYLRVLENIKKLKAKKLPLILKSNALKQNQNEILKIKAFAERILGKAQNKNFYKLDTKIHPRLNQDKAPCDFRLSFDQVLSLEKQDRQLWKEYRQFLRLPPPALSRKRIFLYHCNSWLKHFFINPYGRLKFCLFFEKFSVNLKHTSFREGFYKIFPRVLREKFKTDSFCQNCRLRPFCYNCPARAYLETGNEEAPVTHFCNFARETAMLYKSYRKLHRLK